MAYTLVPTELIVDGAITSAKLDTNLAISGTLGVTGEVTLATHLIMGDNDKIKIGTGGDLEIYHDGSNSYISNSTGNIYLGDTNGAVHIQAKLNEESIVAAADGAVSLYHDNAVKLATTSTGVDVTGTVTSTGTSVFASLDISGDIDVDGTTNLDVVDIDGAVDMASTLQVDGAITSSAGATITTADNTDTLQLISTDADANVGPNLNLYRNSGSPADNDALGKIVFNGRNDNSQDVTYGLMEAYLLDASDGTEDGEITIRSMVGGTSTNRLDILPTETVFNQSSVDLDFRVESNGNSNMLFVDGGNDRVGIGHSAPAAILDIHGTGAKINIRDLTSADTGVGGAISFQGFTSGTGSPNNFGKISGTKASGNVGGVLTLSTSATNGTMTDRMTISESGAATFNNSITLDGDLVHASNLTIDAAGVIILDADNAGVVQLKDGGSHYGSFFTSSDALNIQSNINNGSMLFKGTDGGSGITALTLNMSNAGDALFNNRIFTSGGTGANTSVNADDIVLGLTNNSTERGITIASTAGGGIRWNDGADAGTLQYVHSSNQMQFYTAGALAAVIDSSGYVGISTDNPDTILHVHKGNAGSVTALSDSTLVLENSTHNYLTFLSPIDKEQAIIFGDASNNNNASVGYNHNTDNLSISSVDDIIFNTSGVTRGRFTDNGLCFNADTAAANALDDYEEGTWTPVVKLGTTTVTSTSTGFYTKIGRIITLQAQIVLTNLNSGTGNVTVEGIPFNSANVAHRNHGSVGYFNVTTAFGENGVQARISRNSSFIDFMRNHEISPATNTHVQVNTEFYITITYKNE